MRGEVVSRRPIPLATPEWHRRAACKDVHDPEMFFAPHNVEYSQVRKRALAFCDRCPVKVECLHEALNLPANADWGIRGGMTEGARRKFRADRNRRSLRTTNESEDAA